MYQLVWIIYETKVDALDVGKMKTGLVDLKKISDVVDKELIKNTKFKTLKTKVHNFDKTFLMQLL